MWKNNEKQLEGILWNFQVHTIADSVRRLGATKPRFKSHLHIASDLGIGLRDHRDQAQRKSKSLPCLIETLILSSILSSSKRR